MPSGQITQYYVRHFVAPDPSTVDALVLRVKRDDGIAVYVNGTEVTRDNLPSGTLTAGTYPTVKVTAADGVTWKQFTIPTSVLVNGDNTIAAEVHQDSRSDSRAVFDLELSGAVNSTGPVVTVSSPAPNGSLRQSPVALTGLCTSADGPVTITVGGATATVLTTPCVANGWTVSTALGDGAYTLTASQTDGNGVTGSTGAIPFTVDTAAPAVAITAPTGGVTLASGSPQITGTCSTGDGTVGVAVSGAASRALTRAVLERHVRGDAGHRAADRLVQRHRVADRHRRQHRDQRRGDLLGRRDRAGDDEQHRVDRQRLEGDRADGHAHTDRRGHRRGPHLLHDRRLHADGRVDARARRSR